VGLQDQAPRTFDRAENGQKWIFEDS